MPTSPTRPADVDVVRARPGDWRAWRDVRLRALQTDPDAFGSAWPRERDFTEQLWRERLASSYGVLARIGAGTDAPVVGLGGLYAPAPGESIVVAMWTAPEERGRGVGRAVLEHLLAAAPVGDSLALWVTDANPAVHLYDALGFVGTGRREPIRPGATLMTSEMARPPAPGATRPTTSGRRGGF